MSIVVLGTVALDTVRTPFGIRRNILGGSATHFAMAARLFTQVNLVTVIGSDFPAKYIDFLQKKGIILTSLLESKGETFKWEGAYKGDLNKAVTLHTELGVLSSFRPAVSEEQKSIKHIFLANVDPDIQMYILKNMYSPRLVGLDSMNYWINHKRKSLLRILKKADIYLANDEEARILSGEVNLIKAARYLCSLGPKMILIKKGEHGALFFSDRFLFCIPAYPVEKVVDPTGAGDTFAGGFMGYLVKAKRLDEARIKKAIAYGVVAASFNVEDFGVDKTSRLKLKDLNNRLIEFRRRIQF